MINNDLFCDLLPIFVGLGLSKVWNYAKDRRHHYCGGKSVSSLHFFVQWYCTYWIGARVIITYWLTVYCNWWYFMEESLSIGNVVESSRPFVTLIIIISWLGCIYWNCLYYGGGQGMRKMICLFVKYKSIHCNDIMHYKDCIFFKTDLSMFIVQEVFRPYTWHYCAHTMLLFSK